MKEEILDKQVENKPARDEHGRLLPGNTGNPNGRPKGKTLKEYQAEYFRSLTDKQKRDWLIKNKISGDTMWKMAEGNPKQDTDLNTHMEITGVVFLPIKDGSTLETTTQTNPSIDK